MEYHPCEDPECYDSWMEQDEDDRERYDAQRYERESEELANRY